MWVDVSWEEFKKFSEHHEYHSSAPNEVFIDKTDNAYKNSYFNILTESYFIESQIFFNSHHKKLVDFSLNERNILPINAYQPFIAMNGQGHMKGLRDLGFKTFHPYIDESYDDVVNVHKRFNMIKQEINKLCSMSKQEIHDWYWSMEEIYKHNFNHLHNVFYPTQIKGFLMSSFLNKITKKDLLTYFEVDEQLLSKDVVEFLDNLFPIKYNELNFEEYQEYMTLVLQILNKLSFDVDFDRNWIIILQNIVDKQKKIL